ncbi:MAG TPA: hypothetical protein PKA90_09580 [Ignavibacteria bacterium]|nr:hypothetical protein [Ignavibacteria bacterium]HMR40665.1 hypothetical protein [Ignavibacteria bacterium]
MNIFKIILISILILSANISFGQYDKNKPHLNGQIDSLMNSKLITETGIDQTTADKFIEKYKDNNKQIRELKKEKKEVMKLIKADPSALDVGTKLDKLIDLDYEIFKNRKAFMEDLNNFMTPQQIAGTIVFMNDFSKEFRKRLKKNRNEKRN